MNDTPPAPDTADLIETMAFDPMEGIVDVDAHMTQMREAARERGYPFDRHSARNELQAATFRLREARTVRLLVSPTGVLAIEVSGRG